jgi:hypothetical protein
MPAAALPLDLGALGVVLLLLLAVVAAQSLARLLAAVFSVLPVIGQSISDHIIGPIEGALGAASGWLLARAGDLVGLIWTPVTWVAALFGKIGAAIWDGAVTAERIVTVTIPAALNTVRAFSQQLYAQAVGYVDQRVGAVIGWAQQLVAQATAIAQQLYHAATGYALDLYHAAIGAVQATEHAVSAYALQLYHLAVGYAQSAVGAVTAWVQHLHAQLAGWVTARFTVSEAWVQQEVGALEHDVRGAYDAATHYAQQAAMAAEATALGAVAVEAVRLTRYLEECGNNLCTGLNPLSTALQQLETLLEGGLLFAFVAEAAAHPRQVADDVHAVLSPVVAEAVSLFRDAAGVAA